MSRPAALLLCAAGLVSLLGPGCQCGCGRQSGEQDAAVDAADGRPDADLDAGLDADRPDAWPPRDACDATTIELPPSGLSTVIQVSNMGRYVVYDDQRSGFTGQDIYLYNLDTCAEHEISRKEWGQDTPFIWGDKVIYSDRQGYPGDVELALFDIPTQTSIYVTDGAQAYWPYTNGRYVVYQSNLGYDLGLRDLRLHNIQTPADSLLATYQQAVEDVSISETHASWVAYGGPGKDVYFVELATGVTTHVETTADHFTAKTGTWGDWVVWEDGRGGGSDIYGWQISAGQEVRLTDNGAWNARPTLRGDVMCFRTTLWSGGSTGWDLAVMDLTSGVVRRVTEEPHFGWGCAFVDSGWLVYVQENPGDPQHKKIFAKHLVKLEILDAQGHVVAP